ncbi:MAG: ethanolamine utilization protein EutN [Oligoflexia bacterium]|nr:ethanolamine utilization protein EutN [Oligoflexia bacterium]
MKLGRVKGNVVSTIKHPCFNNHRVLIVQPIDQYGNDEGVAILSIPCDETDAGPGDIVIYSQDGKSAQELLGTKDDPLHSVIIGIVDKVTKK